MIFCRQNGCKCETLPRGRYCEDHETAEHAASRIRAVSRREELLWHNGSKGREIVSNAARLAKAA